MAPRRKDIEVIPPPVDPVQAAIINLANNLVALNTYLATVKTMVDDEVAGVHRIPPADLIAWHRSLEDQVKRVNDAVDVFTKPGREALQTIKERLLARMVEERTDSYKTPEGTAYRSNIMTPGIEEREKYLDFCLENWDTFGNEALQLGAPKVDAVRNYMDEHDGQLPPGVKTSVIARVNIRKS